MNNWKRNLLTSSLVLSIAMPGVVLAANEVDPPDSPVVSAAETISDVEDHDQKQKNGRHHHHALWAHRQMYMTLLVEKYDPASVKEWKTAFTERKRLMEQLKAQRAVNKQNSVDREEEKADKEKANEADKTARRAIRAKYRQNHQEFTEAIIAQDATKIKAVLPKLLEEVKTVNKRLAEKLEKKSH